MTVRNGKITGIVCGRGTIKGEDYRVILWDDDTFERMSQVEFERRFVFLV